MAFLLVAGPLSTLNRPSERPLLGREAQPARTAGFRPGLADGRRLRWAFTSTIGSVGFARLADKHLLDRRRVRPGQQAPRLRFPKTSAVMYTAHLYKAL